MPGPHTWVMGGLTLRGWGREQDARKRGVGGWGRRAGHLDSIPAGCQVFWG